MLFWGWRLFEEGYFNDMMSESYDLLRASEASWWYLGRKRVLEKIGNLFTLSSGNVLDVGSGFGGMLNWLERYGTVDAIELHTDGASVCERRGYRRVYHSYTEVRDGYYDLIALFDVLEHIPDDQSALGVLRRKLRSNGRFIINVPAFPSLWSDHDVAHHHHRRYTKQSLEALFRSEGLIIEYCGYWNMLLLPALVIGRLVNLSGAQKLQVPILVDRLLSVVLAVERVMMSIGRLPFGSSIVLLARAQDIE